MELLTSIASNGPVSAWLGLLSVLLFGLRHGIDHDHIAAITDITGSLSDTPRKAMWTGFLYALGHGVVVAVLGIGAIAFRQYLPDSIDGTMERFVGVTLVALSFYVIYSLIKHRHASSYKLKSRWLMLAQVILRAYDAVGNLFRKEKRKRSVTLNYHGKSAFAIGIIHGIGAETPTQLGLFLFATGVGGAQLGILGVMVFVIGLLITNTIMCAVATGLFRASARHETMYRGLAAVTALYSLVVGIVFLTGVTSILPPL